jgi:predicted outer membrane lipoprotein
MSSFNLVLDTAPAMLCQLAGHGVSLATAFAIVHQAQSLEVVDVGRTIDSQPSVAVEIFSCGYVCVGPSDRDFPLVAQMWDGDRLVDPSEFGY